MSQKIMSMSEFVYVTVHEVTSNRLCEFQLSEKLHLSELRGLIEKELGIKNFRFLINDLPHPKQNQSKKSISSVIHHGVIKIGKGNNLKSLSRDNSQNQELIQPQLQIPKSYQFSNKENNPKSFKSQKTYEYKTFEGEKIYIESSTFASQFYMLNSNHQDKHQDDQIIKRNWEQQENRSNANDQSSLLDFGIYVTDLQSKLGRKCVLKQMNTKFFNLDHSNLAIKMGIFLSFDWSYTRQLTLNNCSLNNTSWSILSTNAKKFLHLKSIRIRQNKIETVTEVDIKQFGNGMQLIDFGPNKQDKNPLSNNSIKVLQKYKLENMQIKILFYKVLFGNIKEKMVLDLLILQVVDTCILLTKIKMIGNNNL